MIIIVREAVVLENPAREGPLLLAIVRTAWYGAFRTAVSAKSA